MTDSTPTEKVETTDKVDAGESAEKLYTKTDIEAIVKKRLSTKIQEIEDLKKQVAELQDTEVPNIDDAIKKALEEQKKQLRDEVNTKLLNAESLAQATELGFVDPADAILYVDRASVVSDKGVDQDALKKSLVEILEAKPHLKKSDAVADSGLGRVSEPAPTRKGVGGLTDAFNEVFQQF
ncbi:MAG: hypothetical protein WAN89_02780 [Lawsonella sp.]